ncbi:MAG TPA: methyltransferase domain-containing protein [Pseudonocardiaceae bacterium]|nr:methyltransferase domain-containing protein [Pseudonocardiaceae bacterium]
MAFQAVNTHQNEAWNGYEGQHWADEHERWSVTLASGNQPLFAAARIGATDRVLDIGCGTGETTRLAAQAAAGGSVLGVDISAPMLRRARELSSAAGLRNVAYERCDAQVFPFAAQVFDVAISRNGVMFFTDPVAAFANIRRALRPDGTLAFTCAGTLAADSEMLAVMHALATAAPRPEPPAKAADAQVVDSLGDPAHTRRVLEDAGYQDISVEPFLGIFDIGEDVDDAAAFVVDWGQSRYHLEQAGIVDVAPVRAAMAEALRPYVRGGRVALHLEWLRVHARNPARTE